MYFRLSFHYNIIIWLCPKLLLFSLSDYNLDSVIDRTDVHEQRMMCPLVIISGLNLYLKNCQHSMYTVAV